MTLEDTLHRTEDALQNGTVEQALSELQETQHQIAAMQPTEIDVAQAASALGVSEPTVRAWARRGLLDITAERPMKLSFASVVQLRRDLQQLRETAVSEKRWQSLLAAAADQRELAEPDAREGFADAIAGNTEPLTRA
jgi:DNA-binding transcriptional MerR regulator